MLKDLLLSLIIMHRFCIDPMTNEPIVDWDAGVHVLYISDIIEDHEQSAKMGTSTPSIEVRCLDAALNAPSIHLAILKIHKHVVTSARALPVAKGFTRSFGGAM